MNIKETLANINRAKYELENAVEENGGELTPELLEQYNALEDMKALLADEGVDELGRWLKSVQDELAARKAEADAAARKVKNLKGYEDYVKWLIGQALDAIGQEKVKGSFYGFARKTSTTNAVNYDAIAEKFQAIAEDAFFKAGLPEWLHVTFKTSVKELQDAEAGDYLETTSTPSLGFTKPRANKD